MGVDCVACTNSVDIFVYVIYLLLSGMVFIIIDIKGEKNSYLGFTYIILFELELELNFFLTNLKKFNAMCFWF